MKKIILKLRNEGKTYNEIRRILGCSKSTISFHCGDGQKEKSNKRKKKNRRNKRYSEGIFIQDKNRKRRGKKKICPICGNTFIAKLKNGNKYCSRKCSGKHSRKRKTIICCTCGKESDKQLCKIKQSKHKVFFCSRKCKDIGQSLKGNCPQIRPSHYKDGVDYRKIAFEHKEKKCERCGYDKVQQILEVHHKDRDRKNKDIENLEVVCPNCHNEEHFFAGDGRAWRKSKKNQEA